MRDGTVYQKLAIPGTRVRALAAAALAFCLCLAPNANAADVPVDLELVFAVDVSGSIDWEEASLQRRGYIEAVNSEEVTAAIRSGPHGRIAVAYIEWAGAWLQGPGVDWMVLDGPASAQTFTAFLSEAPIDTGPWTSISGAIRYAMPMFTNNGYQGSRRVIDISGDGPNNAGTPVEEARRAAVEAGITINGLPIVNDRPGPGGMRGIRDLDRYYAECVIGGPGAFMVVARSFGDFSRAIKRKLVFEIAGRTPEDAPRLIRAQGAQPAYCFSGERQMRGGQF